MLHLVRCLGAQKFIEAGGGGGGGEPPPQNIFFHKLKKKNALSDRTSRFAKSHVPERL